jgi:hypothetical protein
VAAGSSCLSFRFVRCDAPIARDQASSLQRAATFESCVTKSAAPVRQAGRAHTGHKRVAVVTCLTESNRSGAPSGEPR